MNRDVQGSQKDLISGLHNGVKFPFLQELPPLRYDETKSAFSEHSKGSTMWLRNQSCCFSLSHFQSSSLQLVSETDLSL